MLTERPIINLGDIAEDRLTGFKGMVIAITNWLNGCQRVSIQPKGLKDGKTIDHETFDAEHLKVVKPAEPATRKPTGGPRISPVQRKSPSRR